MGAVTLTARPPGFPAPQALRRRPVPHQPGVMIQQGTGTQLLRTGGPLQTEDAARPTPAPPNPAVIQVTAAC